MFSHGSSLIGGGWTYGPNDTPITPFSWLTYYQPVTYYGTAVSVCPNVVGGICLGQQFTDVGVA